MNIDSQLTIPLSRSFDVNTPTADCADATKHPQHHKQHQPASQTASSGYSTAHNSNVQPVNPTSSSVSLAGSPSTGLVLRDTQRRESFLYRALESEFEVSPKSVSRHSSIGSEW